MAVATSVLDFLTGQFPIVRFRPLNDCEPGRPERQRQRETDRNLYAEGDVIMKRRAVWTMITMCAALSVVLLPAKRAVADDESSILNKFHNISAVASTVPANGDVNPYGIVQVAKTIGNLQQGNLLISNFNSSANLQGTGTTIVEVAPDGTVS